MNGSNLIEKQSIKSLKSFYDLMAQTREVRFEIVNSLFASKDVNPPLINALKNALASLKQSLEHGFNATLGLDSSKTINVDLTYEVTEIRKDIFYLENTEDEFLKYLESLHPDFSSFVQLGVDILKGKHFNCFITDRDGTTNNYCGRYRSSIQSVYNAMFLTRFAVNTTINPIIITSAPLKDIGLVDISVNPENTIIYAASKGREFIDLAGTRKSFPIDDEKQQAINQLQHKIADLIKEPEYERFSLIGSGFQLKFGQITIARQDINNSIPESESEAFLALVKNIVKEMDPEHKNFRVEDTGLDIEIILTVSDEKAGLKDFDKGDAVKYLAKELSLNMEKGPHLICGDTGSDVPMLEAAMETTDDVWAIYVTKKSELARRVKTVCPNAVIVPEPDMLVAILNQLAT